MDYGVDRRVDVERFAIELLGERQRGVGIGLGVGVTV